MPKLFGIDIAGLVHRNLSHHLTPGTITSRVEGARSTTDPTAGRTITETSRTFRGILSEFEEFRYRNTQVKHGDKQCMLIAGSIEPYADPQVNDRLSIEATTYSVVGILERDPAAATFTLHVRPL